MGIVVSKQYFLPLVTVATSHSLVMQQYVQKKEMSQAIDFTKEIGLTKIKIGTAWI